MRPKCYIPKIEMKFSCRNYSDDIKKEKLCKKKSN